MDTLIVFSHLRWDFVYQRPQHLMTRLAQHYQVVFIEEPVFTNDSPRLVGKHPADNVTVFTPHTPLTAQGFHDEQLPTLQSLLKDMTDELNIVDPIVWLYTPMALPLVNALRPRMIVYDCMDELAAFKNAPRQVLQRESALMKMADHVFTGGPSLYRAKKDRHSSVHCFPSSVDAQHFSTARNSAIERPELLAIPRPRLGFFGVIDERLDLELIERIASKHPEWHLIMVGPVVKIDSSSLPRLPNIHYLGQQEYSQLPAFMAGWDVCLLPFALNEATRFISPTKTLEYMAAGKPIVSTPIEDVVTPYSEMVSIGTADRFVELCELALCETPEARSQRQLLMRTVVAQTSWDKTVAEMLSIFRGVELGTERPAERQRTAIDALKSAPSRVSTHAVVVIGAGPTGLSTAYHLGEDCLLLEQGASVGGWCKSITDNGFTFDCAGHIMFSNDPYVHELYAVLLGNNVHWQNREAWVYSKEVYTRYPFQAALYGLPADVITECLIGAIEARNGPINEGKAIGNSASPGGSSPSACKAESITDCCADGTFDSAGVDEKPAVSEGSTEPRNFEEFIYRVWGKGIAKHFALPYNRKLWAVPLTTMETSWLGGRVPLPNLTEMIEGALGPVAKPMGPNARFGYPLHGGFQSLMDGFLKHLRGTLKLNARVVQVIPSKHLTVLSDGSVHAYKQLVSTMPLPILIKMAGEEAPPRVRAAAARLQHISVRCVNLGIGRSNITDKHWIYYPESSVFHRIFVQGNASPHCNPAGGFGITCEITYSRDKPLPAEGEALIDLCIEDAIRVGMILPDDKIIARNMIDMPFAYVVYDHGRADNVATIRQWALTHDIILAGRYSEWEYYNSDHAFIAGRNAALATQRTDLLDDSRTKLAEAVGAAQATH